MALRGVKNLPANEEMQVQSLVKDLEEEMAKLTLYSCLEELAQTEKPGDYTVQGLKEMGMIKASSTHTKSKEWFPSAFYYHSSLCLFFS